MIWLWNCTSTVTGTPSAHGGMLGNNKELQTARTQKKTRNAEKHGTETRLAGKAKKKRNGGGEWRGSGVNRGGAEEKKLGETQSGAAPEERADAKRGTRERGERWEKRRRRSGKRRAPGGHACAGRALACQVCRRVPSVPRSPFPVPRCRRSGVFFIFCEELNYTNNDIEGLAHLPRGQTQTPLQR